MRHATLLLLALAALARGVAAQDTVKIEPGERVRLTLSSGRSAVVGALVGLVAGGAAGAALGSSCEGDFLCPGTGGGALLLGGTGLLFGALVGVFVRSERWESVYPEDLGFTVVKTPGGLGVGVSIGF